MKKIVFIFAGLLISIGVFSQIPQQISSDIKIKKKDPRMYFNNNWIGTVGNTGTTLLFNGSPISASSSWGSITGTLSLQTDLENILDSIRSVLSDTLSGSLLYGKLIPDTVHVTDPTYTVLATNASKVHVFYNDFTLVTIASYVTQPIPVGSWTTFINIGGKVKFTGPNVHSELDSLCLDNPRGVAQLWKQGENNNLIIGSLK